MNSRARRVKRRAAERRKVKQDRRESTRMLIPDHIEALVELLSER